MELDKFIWMSKYAGMREDIVQAGGGNSSFKESAEKMYIKASGVQLADITENEGYAVVNPLIIKEAMNRSEDLKVAMEKAFLYGGKPSIETFLHAVMGKYTLHTHPVVVSALVCRKNWKEILSDIFPEAIQVPYATPGQKLAEVFSCEYARTNLTADIIFLQNHGLVVSGETAEAVIEKTEDVLVRAEKFLGVTYSDYRNASILFEVFPDSVIWKVTDSNVLEIYRKERQVWDWGICPDGIVFLGKCPFVVRGEDIKAQRDAFERKNGLISLIEYHGNLYLRASSVRKALEMQSVLSLCAQVEKINQKSEQVTLKDQERDFLLGWEVEKYRRSL